MNRTLATMLTVTTYGTWLRGDMRGWVEDGIVWPPDPILEATETRRMKHSRFVFERDDLLRIGQCIGDSLRERLNQRIHALSVQCWHVHVVIDATPVSIPNVVKCLKDAVRWGLRPERPIWTDGYDKRFCFDDQSVRQRIEYVERHNLEIGWPAQPWTYFEHPQFDWTPESI